MRIQINRYQVMSFCTNSTGPKEVPKKIRQALFHQHQIEQLKNQLKQLKNLRPAPHRDPQLLGSIDRYFEDPLDAFYKAVSIVGSIALVYLAKQTYYLTEKINNDDTRKNKDKEKSNIFAAGHLIGNPQPGQQFTLDQFANMGIEDINLQDRDKNTLLFYAVTAKRKDLVKHFLERGAQQSIVIPNIGGITPFCAAVISGDITIFRALLDSLKEDSNLQKQEINRKTIEGWTPLLVAAYYKHFDILQDLLNNGADLLFTTQDDANFTRDADDSALTLAVTAQDASIIKYLLKMLHNKTDGKATDIVKAAFWKAASHGYIDVVRLFIADGYSLDNQHDFSDRSPLCSAIKNGHLEVVKLLCNNYATLVSTITKDGRTPLDFIQMITNGKKQRPEYQKYFDILDALKQYVALDDKKATEEMMAAASAGKIDLIAEYVRKGAQLTQEHVNKLIESKQLSNTDSRGNNIIHFAARLESKSIIESIIKEEPSLIKAKNDDDFTPFYEASL